MDISNPLDRAAAIKKVLVFMLLLNWAVALAKIVYGMMTHFTSMIADGLHSLSDGASNIVGLIGISMAATPPDKDHPYGHKKYETLFSLFIVAMLFYVAINLFISGAKHIFHPVTPRIDTLSFVVMLITMAVNIIVMRYENAKGQKLMSDILVADSMHTRTDVFTSLSVIVALVGIKMGMPLFDPIVTMMIGLFIAYSAIGILKTCAGVLVDAAPLHDSSAIENAVKSVEGVRACHKIRTRGREDDIHVDLHVHVSPNMHVNKAHDISQRIEEAIKRDVPGVTDVVVHIEPLEK